MSDENATMSMIADEVKAFAERRGWRWQVRRAWGAREKPVNESDVLDYEWKLVPHQVLAHETGGRGGVVVDDAEDTVEGWYYVLKLRDRETLELSHGNDWSPGDAMGGWWSNQRTSTTIRMSSVRRAKATDVPLRSERDLPVRGGGAGGDPQPGRSFRLDRNRDRGIGRSPQDGSIALSNWLIIMTDRYDPNWFCIT
jgi:hypothetical protein